MKYAINKQGVGGYGAFLEINEGKFSGINIRCFTYPSFSKNKEEVLNIYNLINKKEMFTCNL